MQPLHPMSRWSLANHFRSLSSLAISWQNAAAASKKGVRWTNRLSAKFTWNGSADHPCSWKLKDMQILGVKHRTSVFGRNLAVSNSKSKGGKCKRNQAAKKNETKPSTQSQTLQTARTGGCTGHTCRYKSCCAYCSRDSALSAVNCGCIHIRNYCSLLSRHERQNQVKMFYTWQDQATYQKTTQT